MQEMYVSHPTAATSRRDDRTPEQKAWDLAATVCDPEIPVLTIEDLGILRAVQVGDNNEVTVTITPTYSGCPAMDAIRDDDLTARLTAAGAAVEPSSLRADFDRLTGEVLAEAELEFPQVPAALGGGRQGKHSEHLGYMLAEMQVLARQHPGASW
jgi:metal-sulfur cluster biosynthetic enzyme